MKSNQHKTPRQKATATAAVKRDGQPSVPKPEKIEHLLSSAGIFADDPDFVRIMNEAYSETRGRVVFDE
jgi:hypothetical protein